MTEPTTLDLLLAVQRLYDETPRWRPIVRGEARRTRERLLRDMVADPPRERPRGEAPLLRGL
jgi:hypothetical protein